MHNNPEMDMGNSVTKVDWTLINLQCLEMAEEDGGCGDEDILVRTVLVHNRSTDQGDRP